MNQQTKIAIIDLYAGHPNEGMRCIKALIENFIIQSDIDAGYRIFDVRGKEEIPDLAAYDIFISTGGPGSPLLTGANWEKIYFEFIDEIIAFNTKNEERKSLFLICHSFQLMVQHWNLAKVSKRKSTSFGVMPVHKTEEGQTEELFLGLEDPFWAVDSRDFQVISPALEKFKKTGAKILALEKERPHVPLERAIMAIRFTENIIGVQFHPEADSEGMIRYFEQVEKRNAVISEYGQEKYDSMIDQLDDDDKIKLTESVIIPRFLKTAYENLKPEKVS